MPNQYFEDNTKLASNMQEFNYYFKEKTYTFISDIGVFSKKGIDFGSSLLLKTLPLNKSYNTILDVGCGYGPIGIIIADNYKEAMVDMIDVNNRAIELAKVNAIKNKVNNVKIFNSNIYENIDHKYDLIITNPPIRAGKKIVHEIILGAIKYLNENGELWCVIQKKQGAPSAYEALCNTYKAVKIVEKENGYWIIQVQ